MNSITDIHYDLPLIFVNTPNHQSSRIPLLQCGNSCHEHVDSGAKVRKTMNPRTAVPAIERLLCSTSHATI